MYLCTILAFTDLCSQHDFFIYNKVELDSIMVIFSDLKQFLKQAVLTHDEAVQEYKLS